MRALPSGTVTFVFTDIEGSTRLLRELGDRYPAVLAQHRRALRSAFAAHGGVEVDTAGDAFFVAFADAAAAVRAIAEGQAALNIGPVRVRAGVHTGKPIVWEEGYAGLDVHRGARICAAAHGGQTVLSERARAAAGDIHVRDLGLHRLKDLLEPQRLFQLGDGDFPPLRTLYATNLPIQPTVLVGRERELAEAGDLLARHRLVTLTGAGGSGKTRLALQLAAEAVERYPDGVVFVPLQAVAEPVQVEPTIAAAVGARNGLAAHLETRRMLLVLDNLEQVIEASSGLAALLAGSARLTLLATSREPLRIAGERRYPVEPLAERDALALFTERALAVDPGFEPDAAALEICRRLDGLPLALELAAARLGMLTAGQLLAALDRALPVLTHGARDAPERQRALAATIAWSNDLLDPDERQLFRRLGVFAASFGLDAIEPVCRAAGMDTLQGLVDRSLVRRWASGRLGMLQTIHEFARDRLDESGEALEVERRHAEHYLAVARGAHLGGLEEGEQDHELGTAELGNFRLALARTRRDGDPVIGLRLAVALINYFVGVDAAEGERWIRALLERAGAAAPPELRAEALLALGGTKMHQGEIEAALDLYQRSLDAFRAAGDQRGAAVAELRLVDRTLRSGDIDAARAQAQRGLATMRRLAWRRQEAVALGLLAGVERAAGQPETASRLRREAAEVAAASGFLWWRMKMLALLCEDAIADGLSAEAGRYGLEALELAHTTIRDRESVVYLIAMLARIAGEAGDPARAGRLWGAIESAEQGERMGAWEQERDTYAAPVLALAGVEFDAGQEQGRRLSLDQAVEAALAPAGPPPP